MLYCRTAYVCESGQSRMWNKMVVWPITRYLSLLATFKEQTKIAKILNRISGFRPLDLNPWPLHRDQLIWQFVPTECSILCIYYLRTLLGSRDSDWLRAGRPRGRSSSPGRGKIFLLSTSSRPALGPTHSPIEWVPGALSPGLKRLRRSRPTSAKVRDTRIYTSTPPHVFTA
jgi:hypothetical protein